MVMFVGLRTGEMLYPSTAGFAVVTTAILPQNDSPPQVAREFEEFFWQWHGLVKICQEVTEGLFCHRFSLFKKANLDSILLRRWNQGKYMLVCETR